ncbi:MAG: DUF2510 domain-containing protein [Acidimicrobiia bacterium]|nr:DUF2510 domain-containing protein [Acidimicrobiia bacterium]
MSAPGWYPDQDPRFERWWDGTDWTEHRRAIHEPPPPSTQGASTLRPGSQLFGERRWLWWIVGASLLAIGVVGAAVSAGDLPSSQETAVTASSVMTTTTATLTGTEAPTSQVTEPVRPATVASESECQQDVAAAARISRFQDVTPDLFPALESCASVDDFLAAIATYNDGRWPEPMTVQPNLLNICNSAMWPSTPVDSPVCSEVLSSQPQTSAGCVLEEFDEQFLAAHLSPECFQPWTFRAGDDPVVWCQGADKMTALEWLDGIVPLNDAARASSDIAWIAAEDSGLDTDTLHQARVVADELCDMR